MLPIFRSLPLVPHLSLIVKFIVLIVMYLTTFTLNMMDYTSIDTQIINTLAIQKENSKQLEKNM